MPTYRTRVGDGNSVVLPAELCEKLGVEPGVEVEFFLSLDGEVFFHAITGRAGAWKGAFGIDVRKPPISIREMDAGIADHLAEDDARIRGQHETTPKRNKASAAE